MPPAMFQPFAQARSSFVYISAKTNGPPMSITPAVRDAVASLNPDIPLYWVSSFEDAIAQSLWFVRVFGTMFMIFGFVALFLASVGLYAVMSFSVIAIAVAIVAEGGLAFLGLSVSPPTPTWGGMISDGRAFIADAWWISMMPCLVLFLTVLALNLAGDRLREFFDIREGAL